eukprot:CAMPEP_0170362872 /NCGR_PEP_ID=MMETSP0117_2-20130122/4564_1 /TAXON_ID=400756 /ORGANISM="Durinskia baltica, Strain CSIRO CS-38" /LENGTH=199 /DNA_ID=CAMNT_0010617319 /DNA_START=230 /DNA_END=826 /DNA_ORIENTATION=-
MSPAGLRPGGAGDEVAGRELPADVIVPLVLKLARARAFASALWDVAEASDALHCGHGLGQHHAEGRLRRSRAELSLAELAPEVGLHDADRRLPRVRPGRREAHHACRIGDADELIVGQLVVAAGPRVRALHDPELDEAVLDGSVDGDVGVIAVVHELQEALGPDGRPRRHHRDEDRPLRRVEAHPHSLGARALRGHLLR